MEVKLSQRRDLLLLPKLLPKPTLPSHCFSILNSKSSIHKRFRGLASKWRFRIQEMLKVEHPTEQYFVHVVKEGETLSSISKQYGISIYAIAAANKNILDIDLVFKGQSINIPSATRDSQVCQTEMNCLQAFKLLQNHLGSLNILDGLLEHKNFIALSSHSFPHAKTTGYFLVLVPLIAFCIRCIIAAFHTRAAGELRSQVVSESEGRQPGCRSVRWKSALSDIRETDNLDAESSPRSYSDSDDQSQASFEEVSQAYSKLEQDYQKFLSECGMTE
ncbi:hypothetical protein FH972_008115 [Carpinus fangiana]|uniref:LysM domain-containing protein n=1 Tax=Carpinus fangiana TaxID=176857 RepID=A0A5N6R0F9_9ROSI|nr:hypothetical protein FH972_008115 [Carpinus fangiana]